MGFGEGIEFRWQFLVFFVKQSFGFLLVFLIFQSRELISFRFFLMRIFFDEVGLSFLFWMIVCLKSLFRRWGRKQLMRFQVIFQRVEGLFFRVFVLWKIFVVFIIRSIFFRDLGMVFDCGQQWDYENRKEGMVEYGKEKVVIKGEIVSFFSKWERKQVGGVGLRQNVLVSYWSLRVCICL